MNKYHKQCICMVLIASILAGGAGLAGFAARPVTVHAEEYKNSEKEEAMENIVETVAGVKKVDDGEYDKEETVFVISDPCGNPTEIIASEWLKNMKGSPEIEDRSELKDIKNVKGYEEYKKGKDGSLIWNAGGKDIYYQGTPVSESPVAVRVTYYLNGSKIKPEELKGKSGRVRIRFDYDNKTDATIEVDGKSEHVSIPFTMLTGVLLPNETFSNVSVENARIISEGNNTVVIGYAFPGLDKSLKYDEFKEDLDEVKKDKAEDLDISDHVEITADVTDFELNSTLTVALPDVLQDVSFTDNIDTGAVKDDMDELADASKDLTDGTSDLLDGVNELKDGTSELKDGTSELKDGTRDLKDGTEDILSGSADLMDGAEELRDGICRAYGGTKKIDSGSRRLDDGASDAYKGSKELNAGVKKVASLLNSKSGDIRTLNSLVEYLEGQVSPAMSADDKTGAELASRLVSMNAANDRAAAKAEALLAVISENAAKPSLSDDEAEREGLSEEIKTSVSEASLDAMVVFDAAQGLSSIIEEKIEEMEEEKEKTEEELSELGEPDPDAGSWTDDTESVSGNGNDDEEEISPEERLKERYSGYYREYYQKYYELTGRMEAIELVTDLLEEISEPLDSLSVSVNELTELLTMTAEKARSLYPEEDDEGDREEGSDPEELMELLVSANEINTKAASSVWAAVEELQAMNMLDDSYTSIRYMASDPGSSMTPEQLVQQLLSIPDDAMRNQVMRQMMSDPSTQVQAAAVIASLQPEVRSALNMDTATTALLNTVVKGVVSQGMKSLTDTLDSPETKKSLSRLTAGAGKLMDGLDTLSDGTDDLRRGTEDLRKGMRDLDDGGVKLYDGTVDLNDGAKDLDEGAGDLDEGVLDLDDGAEELDDGVGELLDGAEELNDGMIEFNDEGIQKLMDLFGDNVTDMLDRLDAIQKTGASYQTFSGKSDDMQGSVKFILKTGEIKSDE